MNRDWITMQTKQYRICKKGQEDNDRTSRRRRLVFLGITIAVIIIILILLLSRCGTDQKEPIIAEITQPPGFSMIEGNLNAAQSRSKEEIQNELRRKVEEGMMNISMNLNPVFANGFSEGNLMIVNEEVNRHPQIVEIYYKGENRQTEISLFIVLALFRLGNRLRWTSWMSIYLMALITVSRTFTP